MEDGTINANSSIFESLHSKSYGGAIQVINSNLTLTNSIFIENTA